MKVLIINNIYYPYRIGGAEVSVQVLAEGLKKQGYQVLVIALGNVKFEQDTPKDVSFITYPYMEKLWPVVENRNIISRLAFQYVGDFIKIHASTNIRRIIHSFMPDVVHTNNLAGIGSCVWSIVSNLKVPIVHTLRDYYHLCIKQTMYNPNKSCNCSRQCKMCLITTVVRRIRSSHVNVVVGNSEHILQSHLREGYFKNARTDVVSGGLPDSFRLSNRVPTKSVNRVGYLGQIVKTKGVNDFINLAYINNSIEFLIGGDNTSLYASKLQDNNLLHNLKWMGRVDPKEFLDSIDILIVPSKWHEPLPRVIYEAYSRGVLVVATKNGGNPSVMDELPKAYRYLYESNNFELMTSTFQKAVSFVESNDFKPNILIDHSILFSESNIIDKYCRIYEGVKNFSPKSK
ncbi:hypothetical protein A3197_20410 [Candidatus Thiodiazotropha endoloripes]|nr:hypothetical protein A3197_20410 [Candidatus Thiodiazotropha endoloripes]